MGKILLSKDYGKVVMKGLLLPERDVIKYYTNITAKHHPENPEMFIELKDTLNNWIEWYKGQVTGGTVRVEMTDGTIKYMDRNQTWESDGDGDSSKNVYHDLYEHKIFLFPLTSERNVKVNKAYFERHLKIVEDLEIQEKLKMKSYVLNRVQAMIEKKIEEKENIEKYIIKSDDKCRKIFDVCLSAFDCDYSTFRKCIETANFKKLKIKKQNVVQDLTYRLSGEMGKKWYSEVCEKMKWKKSVCSGQGKKVELYPEIRKVNNILPRP